MMGYFSNGTEGEMYQARWCARCWHDREQDCPVWLAQLMHNTAVKSDAQTILHLLIPRTKDGLGNEQCSMFIEREKVQA